jgi:hypothetical protein
MVPTVCVRNSPACRSASVTYFSSRKAVVGDVPEGTL